MVIIMNTTNDLYDYIEKYGELSFSEKSFNEIDGVIFSQLAYVDFKGIVDKEKVFLSDAAMKYFSIHSEKEIEELIDISNRAVKLLMKCATTRRYGWCELCYYLNNVNEAIDKQFCGINFILDNEIDVIAFRGTDATVTGAKESAMLSYMFPVPAQIEALHYFQETAMLSGCRIITVGHSKGGNLAVFAAVNCSNSLKKMLDGVYEYDAPGFPKWFFDRYDYQQIKDKIYLFTPQGSIIGRMLYHDANPSIVKSVANGGMKQHNVTSWKIDDDKFEYCDEYDHSSNFEAEYINNLIDYVGDDDLEMFFDAIVFVVNKLGIDDFYDMKDVDLRHVFILIDSLTTLDEAQKERFKQILKKASADFAKEYFGNKAKSYTDKAKGYFEKIMPNRKED